MYLEHKGKWRSVRRLSPPRPFYGLACTAHEGFVCAAMSTSMLNHRQIGSDLLATCHARDWAQR